MFIFVTSSRPRISRRNVPVTECNCWK